MRRAAIFLALLTAGSTLACAWLDQQEDPTRVTHNVTIPVEFDINGNKLCESSSEFDSEDCQSDSYDPAGQTIPLPRVEQDVDIDIPERTGRPELRDAAGRFEEITITEVDYEVVQGTSEDDSSAEPLSFDVPEVDLHTGPQPATQRSDEGVFRLVTFPEVDAGEDYSSTEDVRPEAEQKASELFRELVFSAIPSTKPEIESGQDVPPHGRATVEMKLHVQFVASGSDQV